MNSGMNVFDDFGNQRLGLELSTADCPVLDGFI